MVNDFAAPPCASKKLISFFLIVRFDNISIFWFRSRFFSAIILSMFSMSLVWNGHGDGHAATIFLKLMKSISVPSAAMMVTGLCVTPAQANT